MGIANSSASRNDPFDIGPNDIGVYLKYTRVNHSCRPNAVRACEDDIVSILAMKDIAPGEETTISYLDDNFLTTIERHKQMCGKEHNWESCQCELCTSPERMRLASDQRRRILFSMRAQLINGTLGLHSVSHFSFR
jgi:hypothetical protein